MKSEIRTRLQHAWATAVETVDAFTGQALKSSIGQDHWKRFFVLMSSVIARQERKPIVPGAPTDPKALSEELRAIEKQLNAAVTLESFSVSANAITQRPAADQMVYLLKLDTAARNVLVTEYLKESPKAAEDYLAAEKGLAESQNAVLVSVDKLSHLSKAFPNYYADTKVFVQTLREALAR